MNVLGYKCAICGIVGYLLLAASTQLLVGNFPLSLIAFPINAVFAFFWLLLLWKLYKKSSKCRFAAFLSSSQISIASIFLLMAGGLIIGLFPQLSDIDISMRTDVWTSLGCYNFMTSWIFIAILFLLLSNLAMVVFHAYFHRKHVRWRFLLNHVGLWLALFAGFFGSSDTQILRILLHKGEPVREAFTINGVSCQLNYEMELRSFSVEYYPDGRPSHISAKVRLGDDEALLEVNRPYNYRLGEDVYLTGYDATSATASEYCVLQIVVQPWKYVIVIGILMMLTGAVLLFVNGSKKQAKLERYDKLG